MRELQEADFKPSTEEVAHPEEGKEGGQSEDQIRKLNAACALLVTNKPVLQEADFKPPTEEVAHPYEGKEGSQTEDQSLVQEKINLQPTDALKVQNLEDIKVYQPEESEVYLESLIVNREIEESKDVIDSSNTNATV